MMNSALSAAFDPTTAEPGDLSAIDSDVGLGWVSGESLVLSANAAFARILTQAEAVHDVRTTAHSIEPGNSRVNGRSLLSLAPELTLLREVLAASTGFCLQIESLASDNRHALHVSGGELKDGHRLVVLQQPPMEAVFQSSTEAELDHLTGLGNRRFLDRQLDSIEDHTSNTESVAALLIDLDHFKHVNDTLGHAIGDELLKLVAGRIRRCTQAADKLVRLGDDEFIVLQIDAGDHVAADLLASRLVELLGRPFLINGQQINIGASIGIALYDPLEGSSADLLRHADLALYAAKDAGRNCHSFFEPKLEIEAIEKRALEVSLRRALGLRQFELHYQPQVDLPDGTVTGCEALIRWNHPERGLVGPDDFIPLAEETGDIVGIGEWALRTACIEAMNWPKHMTVAVNVSPVQFRSPRFFDSLLQALHQSGLPPGRLEIEITEGLLIDDPQQTLALLKAIRDLGVGVAMDDFGTGYSSLSYLSAFPFSKIKIDRSFVHEKQDLRSRALVQAILSLGDSLGMSTLAEGVETADQYQDLSSDGCRSAQGYLISRPIPTGELSAFLEQQHGTEPAASRHRLAHPDEDGGPS